MRRQESKTEAQGEEGWQEVEIIEMPTPQAPMSCAPANPLSLRKINEAREQGRGTRRRGKGRTK